MAVAVDLHVTETQRLPWPAAAGAPQDRLHADDELGRRERLRKVVVGALGDPLDAVGDRAAGRKHEDRDVGILADAPSDRHPIELGQHQIEHDQIGCAFGDERKRSASVAGSLDREPLTLEVRADELDDLLVIVDDEDEP